MSAMRALLCSLPLILAAACNPASEAPGPVGYGADPKLPPPQEEKPIPTLNAAKAVGWPAGGAPTAPAGFTVTRYAEGLDHPRWLYQLPNGDILVAETNSPPREAKGVEGKVQGVVMKRAGAGVPSANRITLLRDADGDGKAETRSVFLTGLNSPFGMALVGGQLFVANTDSLMVFPYEAGQTAITAGGRKIADLPAGAPNNHWARNVIASPDGQRLYVTVGSNSNIGENGPETERAAVLTMDLAGGGRRVFASGLRNPNGLAWEPVTGALWTTVNERDMLGPDLPPDYMTSLKDGGFYGWPYSYWGGNVDARVVPQRPDLVATALKPDYGLGAHTASLGLAFYTATAFPEAYRGGAFIGQHGSWNRKPLAGYKVLFVPFKAGRPAGPPQDFLTGFVNDKDEALGRPVGVILDRTGALLVADDVGNIVWRVAPAARS